MTPTDEVLDELELQLRRIPGVRAVGFSREHAGLVIHVSSSEVLTDRTELRHFVAQQARGLVDGPLAIEIDHPATEPRLSAAPRPARVRLVHVEVEGHTLDVVVRLTHLGRHGVGRGQSGSPADAARATVRALNALGAQVPFDVQAVASPVGHTTNQAVVVLLASDGDPAHRYGVAQATTVEEAACRATLHALNRWLDDGAFAATA